MSAKSRSRTERASWLATSTLGPLLAYTYVNGKKWGEHKLSSKSHVSLEGRPPPRPSSNPPTWTVWRWGFWSEQPRAVKGAGTPRLRSPREHDIMDHRSWDNFTYYATPDENENCWDENENCWDENENCWCYGGPFWFETTWQGRRPRLLIRTASVCSFFFHGPDTVELVTVWCSSFRINIFIQASPKNSSLQICI